MIKINQIAALCPKHPLGLIGNPTRPVTDDVNGGVGVQTEACGAQAELIAGLRDPAGSNPKHRLHRALGIDQA